jgi:hypothetical protein
VTPSPKLDGLDHEMLTVPPVLVIKGALIPDGANVTLRYEIDVDGPQPDALHARTLKTVVVPSGGREYG